MAWGVTFGALAFILVTTDLSTLWSSLRGANWLLFWGVTAVAFAALLVVDTAAVAWLFRRYHAPRTTFREVLPVRGASYILSILNHAAGSAAMSLYFSKRHRVPLLEGAASILLLLFVDLLVLVIMTTLGMSLLPESWRSAVLWLALAFAVGVALHLLFWRAPWSWGPLERVRTHPHLRGFRDATIADYGVMIALRAPVVGIYVLIHLGTLAAFSIHVPVPHLLVLVPVQMIIAGLPLSISGIGTVQLAQRELYRPFAVSVDQIDAYGLSLVLCFLVPRILIGLVCLRFTVRSLEEPHAAAPDTAAPDTAAPDTAAPDTAAPEPGSPRLQERSFGQPGDDNAAGRHATASEGPR